MTRFHIACISVVVAIVLASALSFYIPEFGEICYRNYQPNQDYCATYSFSAYYFVYVLEGLDFYSAAIAAIATVFIAGFTGQLFFATKSLAEEANRQAEDTKSSIKQATRSAKAMEDLFRQARENRELAEAHSKRQMRAYLTVTIGDFLPQSGDTGNFLVRSILTNTGNTPAHDVSFSANAAITPFPLPNEFIFALEPPKARSMIVGPHAQFTVSAASRNRCNEADIDRIYRWAADPPQSVYIWGVVTYTDVFGDRHWTRFCHGVYARRTEQGETFNGLYPERHNDADRDGEEMPLLG